MIRLSFLVGLFSVLLATGCAKKIDSKRASRQRYFLRKLILSDGEVGSDLALAERLIVTHNGIGHIDIGNLFEADRPEARAETTSGTDGAGERLHFLKSKNRKLIDDVVRNKKVADMIRMVKPNGDLEGYAEAIYIQGSLADSATGSADPADEETEQAMAEKDPAPESPADADGIAGEADVADAEPSSGETKADEVEKDRASAQVSEDGKVAPTEEAEDIGLVVKYYLTHFPVDYLMSSEVSASGSHRAMSEALNIGDGEERPAVPLRAMAAGKADERLVKTRVEEAHPVMIKPLLSDILSERCGYEVRAHGLRVEVRVPAGRQLLARACAEEISRRIVHEVEVNREILRQIQKARLNKAPGEAGLDGIWGHLERHIDLDRKEYVPIIKKF